MDLGRLARCELDELDDSFLAREIRKFLRHQGRCLAGSRVSARKCDDAAESSCCQLEMFHCFVPSVMDGAVPVASATNADSFASRVCAAASSGALGSMTIKDEGRTYVSVVVIWS